jgi:hypothetical protein
MAKSTFPGIKSGPGLLTKVIGTLVALGILFLIIKHPSEAAGMATNLVAFVGAAVDGFASFFQHLS